MNVNQASVRIQFDVDAGRIEEIDEAMRRAGLKTRRELFDHALTLMEWAIDESLKGRQIATIDEASGRFQLVMMPALRSAMRAHHNGGASVELQS